MQVAPKAITTLAYSKTVRRLVWLFIVHERDELGEGGLETNYVRCKEFQILFCYNGKPFEGERCDLICVVIRSLWLCVQNVLGSGKNGNKETGGCSVGPGKR